MRKNVGGDDSFAALHPAVSAVFFGGVLLLACFLMNPVMLGAGVLSVGGYAAYLGRGEERRFLWMIPLLVMAVTVFNLLFTHAGGTILLYVNDNPLTLEAIVYGAASGLLFAVVLLLFFCLNRVMTAERITYLFGRMAPALSMVFSLCLRFVPLLLQKGEQIRQAQKTLGFDTTKGRLLCRMKHAFGTYAILLSWALEHAVETADSMKSRGYGLPGRTAYSNHCFSKRDAVFLTLELVLLGIVAAGALCGAVHTAYYPFFTGIPFSPAAILTYVAYCCLLNLPMLINAREEWIWHSLKSTI